MEFYHRGQSLSRRTWDIYDLSVALLFAVLCNDVKYYMGLICANTLTHDVEVVHSLGFC